MLARFTQGAAARIVSSRQSKREFHRLRPDVPFLAHQVVGQISERPQIENSAIEDIWQETNKPSGVLNLLVKALESRYNKGVIGFQETGCIAMYKTRNYLVPQGIFRQFPLAANGFIEATLIQVGTFENDQTDGPILLADTRIPSGTVVASTALLTFEALVKHNLQVKIEGPFDPSSFIVVAAIGARPYTGKLSEYKAPMFELTSR